MTVASQYLRGAGLKLGFGYSGAMFLAVVGEAKTPQLTTTYTTDAAPTKSTASISTVYSTSVV